MENDCKEIAELLVDYADGELSADEAGRVAKHLQKCENCRNTFNALKKSLGLANEVWEEGLEEIQAVQIPAKVKTAKAHWIKYAAVAAIIVIAATIFVFRNHITRPAEKEMTLAEIEHRITEEGNAARLLAATDLLRTSPEAYQITENQYRYIVKQYPRTQAALQAKIRVEQFKKGDTK